MDISYLLWLQQIRQHLGPVMEQLFTGISVIPESPFTILIPAFLYWCVDKRAGLFLMFNFSAGRTFNQLVKNTVCCYRPWIRDARIIPAQDALPGASGYSFPSGHIQITAAIYGGLGWFYRKKHIILAVTGLILPVLVAFSRNYLGVHTPQDVIMSLAESMLVLWLSVYFFRWMENRQDRAGVLLLTGLSLTALFMIYITFKPYPMDYQGGILLVDPVDMQVDCYDAAGYLSALILGWFAEKKYIRYTTECSKTVRFLRMLIGLFCLEIVNVFLIPFVQHMLDERWGAFMKGFLIYIFVIFLIPFLFRWIPSFDRKAKKA
ncbi:MAG: phosphatase PAP2 family protein [Butyrivibrio sp.]|nr:phosphatase PAP2 family protein [Butyrivibrio sp.]